MQVGFGIQDFQQGEREAIGNQVEGRESKVPISLLSEPYHLLPSVSMILYQFFQFDALPSL